VSSPDYDVLVIGGGFAGVTAARDLADEGHRVLLLEARDRLGGRTFYGRFEPLGIDLEFGGTYVDPVMNRNVGREIGRYSLAVEAPAAEIEEQIALLDGVRRYGPLPLTAEELPAFERAMYQLVSYSHAVESGVPADQQDLAHLDDSFEDLVERLGLPPAADAFLRTWLEFHGACELRDTGSLAWYQILGDLGHSVSALVLTMSHKFTHGTKSLIDAMVEGTGFDVALETPVSAVTQSGDTVTAETAAGDVYAASAAVVALPINCWPDVEFTPELNPSKRAIAAEGHPGTAFKVWALTRGAEPFVGLGEMSGIGYAATDRQLPEGDLVVGFGSATTGGDISTAESVERHLRRYKPEIEVMEIGSHDWNSDPYSKGAWATIRPGWLTRHATQMASQEGRLAFASAEISHVFRGWIDGAIWSGATAARETLATLRSTS
jgi:monoamine oxidase